ncbi:MAG: tRNA (N6-isopentenyl adenosine(37)-C2)-methylthiotransferase MiaB [Eubacteriales bacterium]|nr:tRNA (N6-isopentenyl adenosine(37)-C2)-methylthiotransferase MiaB [Eubacteriales bacterium]MDD4389174.1 tRNA (N6-isopentenyl adenosine(37)-C2)-methylthiotransferase MiaB [Eubacteriales bacterium]
MLKNRKYHILTFGCQMNEHDSEIISGMLEERGAEAVDNKYADIIILNTCSVRENADKRFFGTLGHLKKRKQLNKNFVICVCGCMMQQQHIIDTLKQKYPWVDVIFGTHNIHQFPDILQRVISEKQKMTEVWEEAGEIIENLPAKRLHKHKSFVNIMYGCNNFCTYCIVPYTRGRERSRDANEIIREAEDLAKDGVKEITLLGQNVNSYKSENSDFAGLIYRLNEVDGIERIRFMTSHPKDLSDRLIKAFVDCSKLCKSIHLPVQSGSDEILKRMNRKYTKENYLELVSKIKATVPDVAISTDIIVGFPGETDRDFEETLDLCRQVQYDSAFTFIYSVRKGTPAEKYENQIPEEEKHRRFNMLVDVLNESSALKNQEYVGRTEKVLVDGPSKTRKSVLTGRTNSFKLVNFEGDESLIGQIINVEIISATTFSLKGRIV